MKEPTRFLPAFILVIIGMIFFSCPKTNGSQEGPAEKLIGKWIVAGKYGTGDGEALFNSDMTYTLKEIHPDGTAVTHEGEFRIDTAQEPYAIDLCPGKFSNPGSEWVTTFGILRFLSDDEAEIHFDPSGKRPASFDGATAESTHKLTRKKTD